MRALPALALAALLAPLPAAAEVIRCTDEAGNVSYTDSRCPAGTKQMGRVPIQEPPPVTEAERQRRAQEAETAARASAQRREAAPPAVPAPPTSSGPIIIDGRGQGGGSNTIAGRDDAGLVDDGYPYPGVYPRAARPRDMRPRIRSCDGTGCQDTQGNHYNRSGQLDRYQGIDGRTCRPVGTTTICR